LFKLGSTKKKEGFLMAQSYKTSINFGLVYIPVVLHAVIKPNDIGFNMLDKPLVLPLYTELTGFSTT